jgi:hypothetical protein
VYQQRQDQAMAKELTRQRERERKIGEEEKITGEEGNKRRHQVKAKTTRLNTKTGGPLPIAKRTRHNPDTSCISTQAR